ncbi:MAG: hypothetical protein ABII64_01475 [Elusimicrobiota bacterium]
MNKPKYTHDHVLFLLFTLNSLFYIWFYRFLPLQDYPDWLFQGLLFSKALKGQLMEGYRLIGYPVANSLSTVFIGLFALLFNIEISGKILLSAYALVFIAGSFYMLNSLAGRDNHPFHYAAFLFLFNCFFFAGNINYVIGLGILFFGMGYILRNAQTPEKIGVIPVLLASVLLFYSHAVIFMVYLFFAGLFALSTARKNVILKVLAGLLPSIALFGIFAVNHLRMAKAAAPVPLNLNFLSISGIAGNISCLSVFQYFYPVMDANTKYINILNILNLAFCLVFAVVLFYGFLKILLKFREHASLAVSTAVLSLFAFFNPGYFAGIVRPGERLIFPAVWIILAFLAARPGYLGAKSGNIVRYAAIFAVLAQAFFLYYFGGMASNQMAGMNAALEQSGVKGDYTLAPESHFNYENTFRTDFKKPKFLGRISPLIRLPYYLNINNYAYTSVFPTGIFISVKEYAAANSITDIQNNAASYRDNVIIAGHRAGNNFIAGKLSKRYKIVIDEKYFMLLKKK